MMKIQNFFKPYIFIVVTFILSNHINSYAFKKDNLNEKKIEILSERILRMNQILLDNSAAAFDAIDQHLSKLNIEKASFTDKWYFSLGKVVNKVIFGQLIFSSRVSKASTTLLDMFTGKSESTSKMNEAIEVNSIRDLMESIATKRTLCFPTDQIALENIKKTITIQYKKEGDNFLNELELMVKFHENELSKDMKSGKGRYFTGLFKLAIAEELINGITEARKSPEGFLQCIVKTSGCKGIDWKTNKNGCVKISQATYKFKGSMAQQFESMVNKILNDFENEITISDFNVPVSYKFYLHESQNSTFEESYSYIITSKMNTRLNPSKSSIYYYYGDELASKNQPTYTDFLMVYSQVISKLNRAKFGIRIGEKFYEEQKIN
jgi:hypothetical protein